MRFLVGILISILLAISIVPTSWAADGAFARAAAAVDGLVLLRQSLNEKYQAFINAQGVITEAETKLEPLTLTINSLEEQLRILNENIARSEEHVRAKQRELVELDASLADLSDVELARAAELHHARGTLSQFLRLAYADRMAYTDWQTGQVSTIKFLLAGSSLADTETRQAYLTVLAGASAQLIGDLAEAEERYATIRRELLTKRGQQIVLAESAARELADLDAMRASKDELLAESRGQEAEYKKLLEQAQADQAAVTEEIATLRDDLAAVGGKLDALKKTYADDPAWAELLAAKGLSNNGLAFVAGHTPRLAWPVDPSRGITAFYQDESYKAMFDVPHYAIDIRSSQGSPVRAAGPGVVMKTYENGNRYAFIVIAHPGELMTVYGHISNILVKTGDEVRAGDTIGLSGGTPGTHGAGLMTTGPHLHFEVFEKGTHENPLGYLPLEPMRREDVPKEYIAEE